jgi:hypothetical protein
MRTSGPPSMGFNRVAVVCAVVLVIVCSVIVASALLGRGSRDNLAKRPFSPAQAGRAEARGGPSGESLSAQLPRGVTLRQIDGGPAYFSKWHDSFPSNSSFIPIGVFPAEGTPSSLKSAGINFFTPVRNDSAGIWCPVWNSLRGDGMESVNAEPGFYAGGTFYAETSRKSWGARAAFNVFGDELDGNSSNWFDCLPRNIKADSQTGDWGGLTADALEAAEIASSRDDPNRPTYIQTTVTFMDATAHYSLAQKEAICRDANIFSFDIYPIVKRGGNVWDMYDQVEHARRYCQDSRPVMAFTEMDHMDNGPIYPMPAQTTAEVWNSIMAGAEGVEYFDQYGDITGRSYTGGGRYPPGAMYDAIKNTDAEVTDLAPVIKAKFADGYVSATGKIITMTKYTGGHFYIFAAPHATGSQRVTFALAGLPNTTAKLIYDSSSGAYSTSSTLANLKKITHPNAIVRVSRGRFSATFSNANEVKIYEVN